MVSELYEHLSDPARKMMASPIPARIAFIEAPRWIGTDAALAAHERLQKLLGRPPGLRTKGLLLVGPYFNGKTMIAERFILQHLKSGDKRKVWVVQAREGAGLGHFLSGVITDMKAPESPRSTLAGMVTQIDALFGTLKPRIVFFDEFHNALRGRAKDVSAIFAFLRRIGHDYDISPVLIGDITVYDYINATKEMASRFKCIPIPRWKYDDSYLALLDTLETAMPLARPSELSSERLARRIFDMSEGLIGERVDIVAEAAVAAIHSGKERITLSALNTLKHMPASHRPGSLLRDSLL